MSVHSPNNVFDAPLHVMVGADGVVKLFLPNGESVRLTADAAARSSVLLARAASGAAERAARRRGKGGIVVAVDFIGRKRRA